VPFDNWFDPVETGLRDRAREFLQAMFEAELDEALARSRYALVTAHGPRLSNARNQAIDQPGDLADDIPAVGDCRVLNGPVITEWPES
jgi:hypothetical protein